MSSPTTSSSVFRRALTLWAQVAFVYGAGWMAGGLRLGCGLAFALLGTFFIDLVGSEAIEVLHRPVKDVAALRQAGAQMAWAAASAAGMIGLGWRYFLEVRDPLVLVILLCCPALAWRFVANARVALARARR